MDISSITTFITATGAPTALGFTCLYLLYKEMEEHRNEVKEFTDTISKNNKLLELILQKVGVDTQEEV